MNLDQYPGAIGATAQSLNELEAKLAPFRKQQSEWDNQADLQIAFDAELKNELQRKARRFELLDHEEYGSVTAQVALLAQEKATALTTLEQLRNEFSVAKLQARQKIAEMLTAQESRELVGL
jgi:hypothetical protein